jgi:hypothetical protein
MLSLLNELDKKILDRTMGVKPELETKVLECIRESFPEEYFLKFAKRWKILDSD